MATVKRTDKADAGIHRFIFELAVEQPPHENRARSAVALGAPFLGTAQFAVEPEKVEKSFRRGNI